MGLLPQLSYPISRKFTWWWLGPLMYSLAVLAFIILLVLNVALTGYEVIITKSDDFNATQYLWYNHFTGAEKPGTKCDSYNFTIGEVFTTTNRIFDYSVLSVGSRENTLPYSGTPLDSCDILLITIDADVLARDVTVVTYVACGDPKLPIVAKTTFVGTRFLATSTRANAFTSQYAEGNWASVNVTYMLELAGADLLTSMNVLYDAAPTTAPSALSTWAIPDCSRVTPSSFTSVQTSCTTDTSQPATWTFDWFYGYLGLANGQELPRSLNAAPSTGYNYNSLNIPYDGSLTAPFLPTLLNLVQVVRSAVQIDIGLILPNNVILNQAIRPGSMNGPNIASTTVPSALLTSPWFVWNAALPSPGAFLNAQYLCRFSYPRSWGSALINVLVATFSLFTTGWAAALAILAFMYKTKPEDSHCAGCAEALAGSLSGMNSPGEKDRNAFSA